MCYLLTSRSATDSEEETKLLQCLRKSVLSPCKKQVICLPSSSVANDGTSSPPTRLETRSLTSPHNKGLPSKMKMLPVAHHDSVAKTRSSPRRSTPSKHAVARTRVSTPLRKNKRQSADDRKKTGLTPRRTPGKNRSQTPRKSTKRTPAKSMLTIESYILECELLQLSIHYL